MSSIILKTVLNTTSAIAIGAALSLGAGSIFSGDLGSAAWAQEGSGNGHGGGGQGGGGHDGGGEDGGHDDGDSHEGGEGQKGQGGQGGEAGQGGQGQGGPGEDSEGKGPRAGKSGESTGGKPAWAQEGIPEVELGRLSVARSPEHVLDRALAEALASMTPEMAEFYNLDLDAMKAEIISNWDNLEVLDSPLQNLSLMREALEDINALASSGVTNDLDSLMAAFLGFASDKTVPISTDTVVAVTTILGSPITGADAEALAEEAEAVRAAVLEGHG
ncbi:MAG: hypothetical protein FH759_14765 [Sediminimonas qiaohouensis]|uniref:Uncharacterized protein n=1 Tax=Sediminimonas qiaohouensis TaxID=552061 RepID=A0A7C9HDM1_9RHOB|nr:hypothetical protein [Sediminimonas qiaohouensis]MTJ05927.1 hypothetical protein [Sediminimonas qiaohouensis]